MTRAELMPRSLTSTSQGAVRPTKTKTGRGDAVAIEGRGVEDLGRYGGWKELDGEAPMRPDLRTLEIN